MSDRNAVTTVCTGCVERQIEAQRLREALAGAAGERGREELLTGLAAHLHVRSECQGEANKAGSCAFCVHMADEVLRYLRRAAAPASELARLREEFRARFGYWHDNGCWEAESSQASDFDESVGIAITAGAHIPKVTNGR